MPSCLNARAELCANFLLYTALDSLSGVQYWLILRIFCFSCLIYPRPNEIILKQKIISPLMLHIYSYIPPARPRKAVEGGIRFGCAKLTCEGVQSLL